MRCYRPRRLPGCRAVRPGAAPRRRGAAGTPGRRACGTACVLRLLCGSTRSNPTDLRDGLGTRSADGVPAKPDITAVIGSFCNRSTCGRHVNPVLSLQMNPELVFFQAQCEPHRNCQTPFITFHSRFWHPPQTHPAPVTHFGGILHRFPMNTLPVRDLKTVFEI